MESTLSLTLSDLVTEVGGYLGFGRTYTAYTGWQASAPFVPSSPDSQLGWVMGCVQSGLRQFYEPPLIEGESVAHKWSFLVPEASLSLLANVQAYNLPDDFGGVEGEMNYSVSDYQSHTIIRTGIGEIREQQQRSPSLTGPPRMVAVDPKASDGSTGQRFVAIFWPTPDQSYTLSYRYKVLGRALANPIPYPYGGASHAETILESCLAVAEGRFNDEQTNHRALFRERLTASIAVDVRDFRPERLGYNGDRSDRKHQSWFGRRWESQPYVTYNGSVPG